MPITRQRTFDYVELEWGTYLERFNRLPEEEQNKRVKEMEYESFRDMLAHIIGWWEEGARVITGILDSPAFTWQSYDVDAFNAELTQKLSAWSDDDLYRHYEGVRLALIDLIAGLPEDAFLNRDIESWLVEDVIEHYDEHPIPVKP